MMKYALIVLSCLLVTGCEEKYRYPCQDPVNWDKKECQRPLCEVDGQCRDELTDGISEKVLGTHTTDHPSEEKLE